MRKGLLCSKDSSISSTGNTANRKEVRRLRGMLATLCLLTVYAGTGSLLHAQLTSAIQGTVADQQGLPIVGADVRIRSDETGTETESITDSDGHYGAVGLQPGRYTVTASHDGFTTRVDAHLDLTVNRQLRLDITLLVGSVDVPYGPRIPISSEPALQSGPQIASRFFSKDQAKSAKSQEV